MYFCKKDTKRAKRYELIHKRYSCHHPSRWWCKLLINNLLRENQKDTVDTVGTELLPKCSLAHTFGVKMWKCIFVRLIYSISLWSNKKPLLDVLCRVPPEGLSASRLARPKRTLARLIVKVFLSYKNSLQIQIINFMIFIFFFIFVVGMHKSLAIMSDSWNSLYCSKICIANNSWIYVPKTRLPFRNFSATPISPALLQQPYASLYSLCSDSYWLLAAFHFQTLILYPFAHLLFISLNNFTHFLFFLLIPQDQIQLC